MPCECEGFFTDDDNVSSHETPEPGQPARFHQEQPYHLCSLPFGPTTHRDCRCSLQCRAAWAGYEAAVLRTHLEALPESTHIYFGVLKVEADIAAQDHKAIRVRFLKGLADLAEKRNAVIKVYAVSEIDPGPTARVHYHYCMNSTVEVVQHAVKTVWDRACPSWPTIVHHEPPRSLIGASKYMMKDMVKPGFIRLFRRKTLRITWGNISGRGRSGFYTTPKEDLWRQFNEKIKRTSDEDLHARVRSLEWDSYL